MARQPPRPFEDLLGAARARRALGRGLPLPAAVRLGPAAAAEGRAHREVGRAEQVPQVGPLRDGVVHGVVRLVRRVPVVRRQQYLVSRLPVPPGGVDRHQLVPVAHGRRLFRRIVQAEREQCRGLRQHPRVLRRPGVRGAAGRRVEGRDPVGGLPGEPRDPLAFRVGQSLEVGRGGVFAQLQVAGVQFGPQARRVPVGPAGDAVEDRVGDARERQVVAHEPQRGAAVAGVVRAHPRDQVQVLLDVPRPGTVAELLVQDRAQVAGAVPDVGVDPEPGAPAHLQGEGAEAFLGHQIAEDAVLERVQLVGPVHDLAEADDRHLADRRPERRQVVVGAVRLGGAQRPGGAGQRGDGVAAPLTGAGRGGGPGRRGEPRGGDGQRAEQRTAGNGWHVVIPPLERDSGPVPVSVRSRLRRNAGAAISRHPPFRSWGGPHPGRRPSALGRLSRTCRRAAAGTVRRWRPSRRARPR
ncbi:hypothetical protein STBA_21980 [Streptomyces sp. MP131-18]|nr:hypothetical protein STBA_21980 [Streptomyces sp. MP131-18]